MCLESIAVRGLADMRNSGCITEVSTQDQDFVLRRQIDDDGSMF